MDTTRIRRPRLAQVTTTAVLGAIGTGLITALPARLMMRAVALAAGVTPHFSWAGSAGIVAIFVLVALPGAVVAASWTGRGRWLVSAAGAAFLCIPATGVATTELGSTTGYSTGKWIQVGAAIVGVYACIAALPLVTVRLIAPAPRPVRATEAASSLG